MNDTPEPERQGLPRPLGNFLIVEAILPAETLGGIFLPQQYQPDCLQYRVLAVGPGRRLLDGRHVPPEMKVGDLVLSRAYDAKSFDDRKHYRLLNADAVLVVYGETETIPDLVISPPKTAERGE